VITDFGLARSALNPGISGGSPGYMAPELYAGAPTTVASDIYALGVISVFHLPVGTLGLEDLQSGALLDHVLASGCRIIAWWPDDSRASCEMTNPTVYGRATFRNIVTGDSVNTLWARIEEAQSLEAVKAADYELHFLSVPGIYIEALHLVQGAGTRFDPAGGLFLPGVAHRRRSGSRCLPRRRPRYRIGSRRDARQQQLEFLTSPCG
jgi:hypothetical protein